MHLDYDFKREWPPLSWVAECPIDRDPKSLPRHAITVHHGSRVETHPHWFGECVWDGPFEEGRLDETEVVFGSGARARRGSVTFVSSASMVDRLHYLVLPNRLLVSNSFAALLALSGAKLDPLYPRYYQDFDTVNAGIERYKRAVATSSGPIRLLYHRNLEWDGRLHREIDKPGGERAFGHYAEYSSFLEDAVAGLAANARDGARMFPLGLSSTLSNGFDSTAVTSLLARHGLEEALAVEETDPRSVENIRKVSAALGIDVRLASRYDSLADPMLAVSFLASGGFGYEMQFGAFGQALRGRAIFTGYYGDVVWERLSSIPARPSLSRLAQSGLSLAEFRLSAGFIHCPLPFLGARQSGSIKAISETEEMKPWTLGKVKYDRPIARRIAEEAGVPRETFGQRKMVGSLAARTRLGRGSPLAADFIGWLETVCASRRLSPLVVGRLVERPRGMIGEVARGLAQAWGSVPLENAAIERLLGALRVYGREDYLFKFSFPWAVARHMERSGLARASELPLGPRMEAADVSSSHQIAGRGRVRLQR